MSEGRAAILVATVFFAAVLGSMAPRPAEVDSNREGRESEQQVDDSSSSLAPVQQIQATVQERCEESRQTAEQADLCQQTRMADAAEWLIWITAFEVIALVFVLYYTAKAARAAQGSAAAAINAIASDRACITSGGFKCNAEADGTMTVELIWQNSGRTPAVDITIHAGARTIPNGQTLTFSPSGVGQRLGIAGPNVEQPRINVAKFTSENLRNARDGQIQLIVPVTITYRDANSGTDAAPRQTELTSEVKIPTGITEGELANVSFLNKAVYVNPWGRQNTAT